MKRILRLVVVLGLVFLGLWTLARHQLARTADQFLAGQVALGGRGTASAGTYPGQLDLTLQDLVLVDPNSGDRLESPSVQVSAPSWKPWQLTLTTRSLALVGARRLALDAGQAQFDLLIAPGPDLALNSAQILGQHLRLTMEDLWEIGLARLDARLVQQLDRPQTYQLQIDADTLTPAAAISADLAAIGMDGPIQSVTMAGLLTFAAPLDRYMDETGPRLTAIDWADSRLQWGKAQIVTSGRIIADPQGLAAGAVTVEVTHWRDLMAVTVALGLLSPDKAGIVQKGLVQMADPADPNVVKLTFKAKDGEVRLGPFSIGPAPRLHDPYRQ